MRLDPNSTEILSEGLSPQIGSFILGGLEESNIFDLTN